MNSQSSHPWVGSPARGERREAGLPTWGSPTILGDSVASDDDKTGLTIVKAVLLTLGGLFAAAVLLKVAFPVAMIGMAAAAGYFGFKALAKAKALEGTKDRKALMSSADFDRKMRELDAIDRQLDAEIRKR